MLIYTNLYGQSTHCGYVPCRDCYHFGDHDGSTCVGMGIRCLYYAFTILLSFCSEFGARITKKKKRGNKITLGKSRCARVSLYILMVFYYILRLTTFGTITCQDVFIKFGGRGSTKKKYTPVLTRFVVKYSGSVNRISIIQNHNLFVCDLPVITRT